MSAYHPMLLLARGGCVLGDPFQGIVRSCTYGQCVCSDLTRLPFFLRSLSLSPKIVRRVSLTGLARLHIPRCKPRCLCCLTYGWWHEIEAVVVNLRVQLRSIDHLYVTIDRQWLERDDTVRAGHHFIRSRFEDTFARQHLASTLVRRWAALAQRSLRNYFNHSSGFDPLV